MTPQLQIKFEGDVRGIASGRLSLTAFVEALKELVTAYKRTAEHIIDEAVDLEAGKGGRFKGEAKRLDIEIQSISDGCVSMVAVCTSETPPKANYKLFDDLAERAALDLLNHIEEESKGRMSSRYARKYLAALPPGLTRQTYQLNGRKVVIDTMQLPELTDWPGGLRAITGRIAGVGFEPGRPEVRLMADVDGEETTLVTAATSRELVEEALRLRDRRVAAMVVWRKKKPTTELLWLRDVEDELFVPSPDERLELLFANWYHTLERLAR